MVACMHMRGVCALAAVCRGSGKRLPSSITAAAGIRKGCSACEGTKRLVDNGGLYLAVFMGGCGRIEIDAVTVCC
jgi:hypothetical protein